MNEQKTNLSNIIPPSIIPETKNTNIEQIDNQVLQNNLSDNLNNIESNTSTSFELPNNNFIDNNTSIANNSAFTNSNVDVNSSMINNNNINQTINNTTSEQANNTNNESNIDNSNDLNIISVKKYLINMLLFMIPIIGLIILIVKIFNKKDKNINNFAKAKLIADTIKFIILIIFGVILSMVIKKLVADYLEQYLIELANKNQQAIYENFIDSFESIYGNTSGDINQDYSYDIG